jgi:hypothetical protein
VCSVRVEIWVPWRAADITGCRRARGDGERGMDVTSSVPRCFRTDCRRPRCPDTQINLLKSGRNEPSHSRRKFKRFGILRLIGVHFYAFLGVFVGDEDGKAIGDELPAEYASECPPGSATMQKKNSPMKSGVLFGVLIPGALLAVAPRRGELGI